MSYLAFIFKLIFFLFSIIFLYYKNPILNRFALHIINYLGAFWIKFSQFLSTRSDFLSENISNKLLKMQENVKIDNSLVFEECINENLRNDLENFDHLPIASASLAQIYKGRLKNGEFVGIKILKPKQEWILKKDLDTFCKICLILSKLKKLKRLNLNKIGLEIKNSILNEVNFLNEANNIIKFRANFSKSKNISAPFVYFKYSTETCLVMEWINGKTIKKFSEEEKIPQSRKNIIAKEIINSHLKQVYEDFIFHGDIHHGNIIIDNYYRIYFIDFGIYYKIDRKDSMAVLKIIYYFLNKKYKELAMFHLEIGYINTDVDLFDFENECKKIGDKYLSLNSCKFSIAEIFRSLISVSKKFGMEIQPQLIILQKTMVMLEGVTRTLNTEVSIWNESYEKIYNLYSRYIIFSKIKFLVDKIKKLFF